jgi:flavin reductase (DIM6/NTAB) family NADH-FMN oxidoreductase RutF
MENYPVMALDPENLRAAMRAWSAGVTVATTVSDGQKHGMTVNSFTSISLDPAMITISMQQATRTYEMVRKSNVFGLTILSVEQSRISDLFAGRFTEVEDRFEGLQTDTLVTGSPFIVGGLAWLDCRILQTVDAGMNSLFIAEVLAARSFGEDQPLLYHNRKYWRLSQL